MGANQKLFKEFRAIFIDKVSWCNRVFDYFFTITVGAFIMAGLDALGYISQSFDGVILIVIVLVVLLGFLGHRVYVWFVGPLLQKMAWNENSFLRSLELILILVVLFWFLPLLLIDLV